LVEAATHDDAFWHTAYCSHGPAVLAFLRRRMGREEAEDVLQETFVRAIRAGSYQGDDRNARAYLMATARHVLINRLRRPRLVVNAGDMTADAGHDALAEVPSDDASPEEDAAWGAFRRRLRDVLGELKESYRQAFELGVLQQRSYAEVASLTGWSLPQVKINVYRARRRVIQGLADYLPDAGDSR